MADVVITTADAAARIAHELIETVDDHKDLADADIRYLFTSQAIKTRDRVRLGKATKAGAIVQFFGSGEHESVEWGPDFILFFVRDEWAALTDEQRVYLVDHELSHCYKKIKVDRVGETTESWALKAHDIEGFRRRLVMPEVREFASALQIPLDFQPTTPAEI
jgi:predicted metallopeptidase